MLFAGSRLLIPLAVLAGAGMLAWAHASQEGDRPVAAPPPGLVAQLPNPFRGEPQAAGTYVGAVSGTDIYVALVVQGDQALVYLCDGDELGDWFGGQLGQNRTLDLTSAKGNRMVATVADSSAEGTVTLAGGPAQPFTAVAALADTTGLYRDSRIVNGVTFVFGLIRLEEGARGLTANGGVKGTVRTTTTTGATPVPTAVGGSPAPTATPVRVATRPCDAEQHRAAGAIDLVTHLIRVRATRQQIDQANADLAAAEAAYDACLGI